jgi:hypothetical protein
MNRQTCFALAAIALVIAAIAIGRASAANAATFRCALLNEGGKCFSVTLRGPIRSDPAPGQPPAQWTRDNPLEPKTQADVDNAPPGTVIKNPKTGELLSNGRLRNASQVLARQLAGSERS